MARHASPKQGQVSLNNGWTFQAVRIQTTKLTVREAQVVLAIELRHLRVEDGNIGCWLLDAVGSRTGPKTNTSEAATNPEIARNFRILHPGMCKILQILYSI